MDDNISACLRPVFHEDVITLTMNGFARVGSLERDEHFFQMVNF